MPPLKSFNTVPSPLYSPPFPQRLDKRQWSTCTVEKSTVAHIYWLIFCFTRFSKRKEEEKRSPVIEHVWHACTCARFSVNHFYHLIAAKRVWKMSIRIAGNSHEHCVRVTFTQYRVLVWSLNLQPLNLNLHNPSTTATLQSKPAQPIYCCNLESVQFIQHFRDKEKPQMSGIKTLLPAIQWRPTIRPTDQCLLKAWLGIENGVKAQPCAHGAQHLDCQQQCTAIPHWLPSSNAHGAHHVDCQQQCTWGTPHWLPAAMYMGHTTLTAQQQCTWGTPHWLPAAVYMGHTTLTAISSVHGAHHIDCQQQCTDVRHMGHTTLTAQQLCTDVRHMGHTTLTAGSSAQTTGFYFTISQWASGAAQPFTVLCHPTQNITCFGSVVRKVCTA